MQVISPLMPWRQDPLLVPIVMRGLGLPARSRAVAAATATVISRRAALSTKIKYGRPCQPKHSEVRHLWEST